MDRRGRGGSGDAEGYTIAAEFADVAAVIEAVATATGKPVDLLGHSYGAVCALEATRLTARVRRLVLYEPPLLVEHPPGQVEGLRSLLAEGRRDDLVVTFMREVAGLDDRALAATRAAPSWANRVAAAHTLVRELRVDDGYTFDPAVFASMATPTLLLVGSDSAGFLQTSTERLAEALPDCRVVELPGQSHNAMDTAPELFTDAVLAFLGEA
ncbi:MAG: alpha/beta hydrolase [Euzebyaceae bacterium]|nr:alpha/beta hydrolase [Euzebyaceae bacterium]